MAKQKKKRNKAYRGQDAKLTQPQVIRFEAANRNAVSQWWFEKKKIVKPVLITGGIVLLLVWLIIELIRVVF